MFKVDGVLLKMLAQKSFVKVKAHIPEVVTKELAVVNIGGLRKARLSSNFLPLMGFEAGVRHNVVPIGNLGGFKIQFDAVGSQKVYERSYPKRKNNPFEAVIEVSNQSVLNSSIPAYTERLHYTMRRGEILVTPLVNRTFSIRKRLKSEANPYSAMVALTSGIDAFCLEDCGFTIEACLERRPGEVRDKRDLTETGALNCLINSRPRILINEDLSTVDMGMVKSLLADAPQLGVVHISLQCDDFSLVKSEKLKQKSVEDLSSSRDLFIDALRLIEVLEPAAVVVEQVPGFGNSAEGECFKLKLRKWGYYISEAVLKAPDFGGKSLRARHYMVASVYPGMIMPSPIHTVPRPIWDDIEPFLKGCREVTHTKSLHDGLALGRARLITQKSFASPTLLKSQARQAKDSVFISLPDQKYSLPSIELVKYLQGIPEDVSVDSVSSELAYEILGQSIDWRMHEAVIRQVKSHLELNVGKLNPQPFKEKISTPNTAALYKDEKQLSIF